MRRLLCLATPLLVGLSSCSAAPSHSLPDETGEVDQAFASVEAVLLDFEFDGQLRSTTNNQATLRNQIAAQLMYTVGQLNGDNSVGRFERLALTNIVATGTAGNYSVTYHAVLPVAWGRRAAQPTTYNFRLPGTGTDAGLDAWVANYNTTCVGGEGSGSDRWSFWYYYRPARAACALSPADSVTLAATVTRSPENTTGKYPEYDKVWEDHKLNVVAMFGRNVSGATANSDAGIRDYNTFVASVRQYARTLQPNPALITETPGLTNTPGFANSQVSVSVTLPAALGETPREIHVNVMLVGYRIYQDGATFDAWYNPLTPTADMILYNGHAGLGENVRTLMTKGDFVANKYMMWMVNGCDTFAYVDNTLPNRISAVNGGAPATQFMDTITNAMPSYFTRTPAGSMAVIRALTQIEAPKTYEQIFTGIDRAQVVVVTGEEDNVWQLGMPILPGGPPPPPPPPPPPVDGGAGDGGAGDGGAGDGGPPPRPDAGPPPPRPDAGPPPPRPDAGPPPTPSPSPLPGPSPAPTGGPPSSSSDPLAPGGGEGSESGCACESAPGRSSSSAPLGALGVVVALGAIAARRRR